jgi:antitoxin component YwqK of YwqJK toxin-antitoxin module
MKNITLIIPALVLCGCSNPGVLRHFDYYPTGEFQLAAIKMSSSSEPVTMRTERYQNGTLSIEEYSIGQDKARISFYSDGRLKAEERFVGDKVTFGRYYSEAGVLQRSVGDLPKKFW